MPLSALALLPDPTHLDLPAEVRPLPECVQSSTGWTCPRAPGFTSTYTTRAGKVRAIELRVEHLPVCRDMLAGLMDNRQPDTFTPTTDGAALVWLMGPNVTTFTSHPNACVLRLERA
jgi:hypothetical protein